MSSPLHTTYHILGYAIPNVIGGTFVKAPMALLEGIVGGGSQPQKEGNWLMVGTRYDARRRRGEGAEDDDADDDGGVGISRRYKNDLAFSSLDFFGFEHNADSILREQWFSNERYPYPLYSGHFHTIFGNVRRPWTYESMGYQREEVSSGYDGCRLVLEWCPCDTTKYPEGAARGVVAIVPGLTATCNSGSMQRFVKRATAAGFHCVVLETRGIAHRLTTSKLGCASFTDDIDFVLGEHLTSAYLEKRFGQRDLKLMAVGFSMGGATLCSHLGKAREKSRLHCAMAVCSPFDFQQSASAISEPFGMQVYQPALVKGLLEIIDREGPLLYKSGNYKLQRNLLFLKSRRGRASCNSLYAFDTLITCPGHGYDNVNSYYKDACCFKYLHKIEVPMLCFSAKDDPITGPPVPLRRWDAACEANPNLLYVQSPTGGHLGFARGPIDELMGRVTFMDERLVKALEVAAAQPTKVPTRRDVPEKRC